MGFDHSHRAIFDYLSKVVTGDFGDSLHYRPRALLIWNVCLPRWNWLRSPYGGDRRRSTRSDWDRPGSSGIAARSWSSMTPLLAGFTVLILLASNSAGFRRLAGGDPIGHLAGVCLEHRTMGSLVH
jgi:hypothetical protein